jgi:hypothetical protein
MIIAVKKRRAAMMTKSGRVVIKASIKRNPALKEKCARIMGTRLCGVRQNIQVIRMDSEVLAMKKKTVEQQNYYAKSVGEPQQAGAKSPIRPTELYQPAAGRTFQAKVAGQIRARRPALR